MLVAVKNTWIILLFNISACSDDPGEAERIKNAETHVAEGSYRAAIIELKNAVQVNEENKDLRFFLAQVYLKMGSGVNAEKELRRAELLGMDRSAIIAPLGQAFILQKKYRKALDTFQSGNVKEKKDVVQILLLSGEAHSGLSDYELAKKAYITASKLDPEHPEPLLGLAKIFVKQGSVSQAEIYIEKAKQLAPGNINLALFGAELYAIKGMYVQAEADFKKALAMNKAKGFTSQKFQALTGMATSQILQKKLDAAGTNIDALIKGRPEHPLVRYLQGWLEFQKKNYELANTIFLDLQRQAPNYMPALLLLGASSFALGNYEQANVHLTRFVNEVPTHIQGRKLLVATQLKLNQPEKVMEILQAGIKTTDAELIAMVGQAAELTGNADAHISYLKGVIKKSPDNLLLIKELAKAYMQQGSLKEAIVELESLHKKRGQDKNTALLLIFAQLRAGNVSSARILAQEISQNKPSDPDLHAVLGEVELIAGKRDLARRHFYSALKLQKNHTPSQLSLARLELGGGNLIEAGKWFDKILSEDKTSVVAILGHAQIAEQRGDMEKALSLLEKARKLDTQAVLPRVILTRYYLYTKNADSALELADEVNSLQPDSSNSLLLLGRAYLLAKQPQNAVNTYQKLLSKQPSSAAYTELAIAQRALGNLISARASLKKSIQLDAKYLKAKVVLIELELNSNRYASALKLANQIKRQYIDESIGYYLEGDIYMRQKRYKDAQAAFERAIKKEPDAKLTIKLSRSYFLAGDTAKSLFILNKGITTYPDNSGLRLALARHYQIVGNAVSAEHHYNKLLEKQPLNIVALNNLATLLAATKPEKALDYAQQAYQQAPESMAVADTFGWLLVIGSTDIKKGLEVLTEAVTYGDNPTVKYHLAVALVKNGKKEDARAILSVLVKSGTRFPEQAEASKLFATLKQ